ncbi:MAG: tol-pal system-associated acyl-CoA thioesterase [Methylobacterium sp.]|nr:tol-pal system-associated acyl-CoA thioesterase [Methylobacterium sp.]MCA3615315.1 tol-pal system-associated acyl-CoA thioesterase [Methylobacterium sp.]MCA4911162.1 tol-pal system-associated acyl-CoA thioesterase [Methylobacterium sp.]
MNTLPLRIYYEDTDFSGFVYHARYLHFFERGRTEALRAIGVDQRALFEAEGGPFAFVVRHMTIDFKSPARMDDLVTVETRITELGAASLVMAQGLLRGDTVLCRARVEIAHLAGGKPRRFPANLRSALDLLANP